MKIQRTGICEAILQFDHYLKDKSLPHVQGEFINWFYGSSGFYDKDIKGSYFDIDVEAVKNSDLFAEWKQLSRFSWEESEYLEIMLWQKWRDAYFPDKEAEYVEFAKTFKCPTSVDKPDLIHFWDTPEKIFPYLKGRVLIVNPMAKLLISQYNNAHLVYPTMPQFEPIEFTFPYTLFNDGPDKNSLETLHRTFEEIKRLDFDVALVSCGPYGALITHKLHLLGKTAITMGSGIAKLFAIDPLTEKPNWISFIPYEFRPKGYMKIENGRYWIGEKEQK